MMLTGILVTNSHKEIESLSGKGEAVGRMVLIKQSMLIATALCILVLILGPSLIHGCWQMYLFPSPSLGTCSCHIVGILRIITGMPSRWRLQARHIYLSGSWYCRHVPAPAISVVWSKMTSVLSFKRVWLLRDGDMVGCCWKLAAFILVVGAFLIGNWTLVVVGTRDSTKSAVAMSHVWCHPDGNWDPQNFITGQNGRSPLKTKVVWVEESLTFEW